MRRRVVYMVMFIKNLSLTQRDCDDEAASGIHGHVY